MPPKKVPRLEKGQTKLSFSGSSSETASRPTDAAEASASSSSTSSRTFRAAWLKEFQPWLQYDKEKGMLCSLCKENGRENSFTNGCTNYRHSAIVDHLKTKDHTLARSVPHLQENNERCQEKINSDEEKAAMVAMKAVHWLVKEDLPLSKYPTFMRLLKDLHVPFAEKLNVLETVNYESYDSAIEFLNALSEKAEETLKEKLLESETVTVLADESTDITTHRKLVIYAQVVDHNLKPSTHFVANIECADGSGAGVARAIVDRMDKLQVPISKIMGFGSDGASVMTGKDKGATGMLMRHNPHLVNVHCVAHRLALCTSQAAESIPAMKEFHDTICKLFYYFKQAPARVARFVNIQRILESPELKIREEHGVRWLSFYEALEVVFRSLDPLLTYLQENKDDKAIGLRKKMATTKFISLCYLMMDVIQVVTKLSQFFQKQNIDIAQLEVKLSGTIDELEMLKDSQGGVGHYHKLLQSDLTKHNLAADAPQWESGWQFKGHHVVGCPQDHIQGAQTAFIKSLISNIEKRFPDSALMTAFGILAMRPISLLSKEDLSGWGDEKLEQLLNHFGQPKTHTWKEGGDPKSKTSDPVVDPSAARREWGLAKTTVLSQDYPRGEIGPLWALMATHHRDEFPNLVKLAALVLCCPVQTADCERGFSAQNRILTALRNRLNPLTQNKLLSVKLSTVTPEDALATWKAAKPRFLLSPPASRKT